jgi:3-oxoacyl-[acyl-carrier-protein] synthase-1
VESLSNLEALKVGFILPTLGYKEHGVSVGIRVPTALEKTDQKVMLKLSSGFGGCNAAAMFRIL